MNFLDFFTSIQKIEKEKITEGQLSSCRIQTILITNILRSKEWCQSFTNNTE